MTVQTPLEGVRNHPDATVFMDNGPDDEQEKTVKPPRGRRPVTKNSKQWPPPARGKRKLKWKLKFHHQALPPEYLKHYKQQEKKHLLTENKRISAAKKTKTAEDEAPVLEDTSSPPRNVNASQSQDSGWPPGFLTESFPNLNIDLSQNKAFIENLLSNQIEINRVEKAQTQSKPAKEAKRKAIPSSGKMMNVSDLPYMGEITLDGIKPRRGRKPKKADICHLIYKNYGQVFPGAPPTSPPTHRVRGRTCIPQPESPLPTVSGLLNHSQVQNRIINSLLERRLTQRAREKPEMVAKSSGGEEPLNLCLKDLHSLKIKLSRKHGNVYEAKPPEDDAPMIKSEIEDVESDNSSNEETDITPFSMVTTELRESDDDASLNNQFSSDPVGAELDGESPLLPQDPAMFWPPENYFYPPMNMPTEPFYPSEQFKPDKKPPKKIASKRPVDPHKAGRTPASLTKRKRSAIFIPPVPAENTSNPTTEVSICKFKFTGGAKPSLQEKKMLSVDSGGNFRYYSGTGDKSMRGYEYFPRESLQQCQENTGCSPSGVFLTASALGSGEKIPEDVGHSGFFDQSFPLQVAHKSESSRMDNRAHAEDSDDSDTDVSNGTLGQREGEGSRKSRKTLAREKLEQTFKEKGFLIQTQQLESQGATYCKFRQLRKFTRYLFRSWKDYLPGNVREMSDSDPNQIADLPALPTAND